MDFLDPKKQRRHAIILYVGYALITIAIIISTIILVYQANGYGVDKNGQVVQNGLLFFSSQPNPAAITIDGKSTKYQTNSRLTLPTGAYTIALKSAGYRTWQRTVTVQGGDVQHFDYPFLFPTNLVSKNTADSNYTAAPPTASQSRDRRWILIQQPAAPLTFDLYDTKNPTQAPAQLVLPANVAGSTADQPQNWQVVQWADDNQHVLLEHTAGSTNTFIIMDRSDPNSSQNLNQLFGMSPSSVTLVDNKYDLYELFDAKAATLSTASLKSPAPARQLNGVLNYKTYGQNIVLYATSNDAPAGKVNITALVGDKSYLIRQVAAGTNYLLDMATYDGVPYMVVGASSENEVYVYRDPIGQLNGDNTLKQPAAVRALRVNNPSYVSFSPNTQFIMAEGGSSFGVYDVYRKYAYQYTLSAQLDAPQAHASWMDGDRLNYVSGGKLVVFDYDRSNRQTLMPTASAYQPFYSSDYRFVYSLAAKTDGTYQLDQTSLLVTQ